MFASLQALVPATALTTGSYKILKFYMLAEKFFMLTYLIWIILISTNAFFVTERKESNYEIKRLAEAGE